MVKQYLDPFFDNSTSCTADFAVALILGRRNFNGFYPQYKVEGDSSDLDAIDVAYEHFLEWLDTSIFEILGEEALGIEAEKDDAIEVKVAINADDQGDKQRRVALVQKTIDDCKRRLDESKDTLFLARSYLRDIHDELANKVNPLLREDTAATQRRGGEVCITIASLERWLAQKYQNVLPTQTASPLVPTEPSEPLLDKKGGMSATKTKGFLATFGLLLEAFVDCKGPQFKLNSGTELNLQEIAKHLSERSLPSARKDHYLAKQSVSVIEDRIKVTRQTKMSAVSEGQVFEVIEASTKELNEARANAIKPK